ncbi:hypothetical protein P4O66_019628 [Electrophorus voltai]|uniref:Uncharacterized protein n=1 Tax=Electrophorus voltai TaxID=2609070 RepID=A0AAD9E7Y7_9TELE|nr:hypothetical protein P4O66_019628 [Electrophorus voltai]
MKQRKLSGPHGRLGAFTVDQEGQSTVQSLSSLTSAISSEQAAMTLVLGTITKHYLDQDSISDEAPTESMNSVSPHQPNDAGSTSVEAAQANGPQVNDVTTADGTKSSTEEQDENESLESKEVVKAAPVQRATKTRIASSRKRSKPVGTSKKRTRPLRP